MFCKANIPLAAADTMEEDLAEIAGDGRTLGGRRGLSNLVQPLHAEHIADASSALRVNAILSIHSL
jgi:hypothetical protein